MKKTSLIIILLIIAFGFGFHVGSNRPHDIINAPTRSLSSSSSTVIASVPTNTIKPFTRTTKQPDKNEYIANKKTKKFHKPSCASVRQMNESNKVYYTCTRQEMISAGYDPCGRCNP